MDNNTLIVAVCMLALFFIFMGQFKSLAGHIGDNEASNTAATGSSAGTARGNYRGSISTNRGGQY